jgi:hypothetical protein
MQFFISSRVSENCVRFFSGRFGERASGDLQSFQLLPDFTTEPRHEAVSHFPSIEQLVTFVVAAYGSIKWACQLADDL